MHLLHFGSYEQTLYPFVKHNLRAEDRVQNETAFVEHLLLAADEEGNTVCDITSSVASRYRTGARSIPDNVVALFRKPGARDIVIEYLDDLVVPYIDRGRKQALIKEFVDIVERDKTIDKDYKKVLIDEAAPEHLAVFLADLLIYAVGIDPTESGIEIPEEDEDLRRYCIISNIGKPDGAFFGREKELKSLEDGFKEGYRIQLIGGGDGIGKSRLSLEYAQRHASEYKIICWINTWNEELVISSIVRFFNLAEVSCSDYSADTIYDLFRRFFETNTDWLIIFDNADLKLSLQQEKLKKLMPAGKGDVIITGNFSAESGIEDGKYFALGGLSEEDQIVKLCGGHPVPLTLARSYIQGSSWMTPEIYLHMMEDRGIRAEKSAPSDVAEAAFEIIMGKLYNQQRYFSNKIGAAVQQFLIISAVCNQVDFDLTFLSSVFPIFPDPLLEVCENGGARKQFIDTLRDFGFYEIGDGILHGNTWLSTAAHYFFNQQEQDELCSMILSRIEKNIKAIRENMYADKNDALMAVASPYINRVLYYARNYGVLSAEEIEKLFANLSE